MAFANRREVVASLTGAVLAAHLVLGEVPSGSITGTNGSDGNATFTTASNVQGTSIEVYKNGLKQHQGVDYTFGSGGNTIVFQAPQIPIAGVDFVEVDYIK